jgi:hypothetical protein
VYNNLLHSSKLWSYPQARLKKHASNEHSSLLCKNVVGEGAGVCKILALERDAIVVKSNASASTVKLFTVVNNITIL